MPVNEVSKNELNVHTQTGRTAMVRRDNWKLVVDMEDGLKLYNLNDDLVETTDLSDDPDNADVLQNMLSEFASRSQHAPGSLSHQ